MIGKKWNTLILLMNDVMRTHTFRKIKLFAHHFPLLFFAQSMSLCWHVQYSNGIRMTVKKSHHIKTVSLSLFYSQTNFLHSILFACLNICQLNLIVCRFSFVLLNACHFRRGILIKKKTHIQLDIYYNLFLFVLLTVLIAWKKASICTSNFFCPLHQSSSFLN